MKTDETKIEHIRALELALTASDFDELQAIGANKALGWLNGLNFLLDNFAEHLGKTEQTETRDMAIGHIENRIAKLAVIRCNLRDFLHTATD